MPAAAPAREVQSIPDARTAPDFAASESLESYVLRMTMQGHVVAKLQALCRINLTQETHLRFQKKPLQLES